MVKTVEKGDLRYKRSYGICLKYMPILTLLLYNTLLLWNARLNFTSILRLTLIAACKVLCNILVTMWNELFKCTFRFNAVLINWRDPLAKYYLSEGKTRSRHFVHNYHLTYSAVCKKERRHRFNITSVTWNYV